MATSLARIKAIEKRNKERILKVCPHADEQSGIYIFSREESGFKYGYVGQAKYILTRLAQHLSGYQHIDLSVKKHGFYGAENPTGYKINIIPCGEEHLDRYEQQHILTLANAGYQLRNKTSGSQGKGKFGIAENKPSKGYYDGIKQGYKKAQEEIAGLFKYLSVHCDTDKKRAVNAMDKFNEFLTGGQGNV